MERGHAMDLRSGSEQKLIPHISEKVAWALSLGTTIGWGSLVITGNTYLASAGPMGSVLGLVLGALVMVLMARNYHYMMSCVPEAGGAYAFARECFGYDFGFLTAWFLSLTYFAVLWANATSLPLFARYFLGNVFRFGVHYSIFGYEVYFGEALLSMAALVAVGLLCVKCRDIYAFMMVFMGVFLSICLTICFVVAVFGYGGLNLDPAFIPETDEFSQVIHIAVISPWAFIGFESVSHSTEEFSFPVKKTFRMLVVSLVVSTLLYIFIGLLSVTAYPPRYDSWLSYIRDLGNLSGIEALPPFYAARAYMGNLGVFLLILALFCLILTSLIGNIVALSRLVFALGRDGVVEERFAIVNHQGIPYKAIMLVVGLSLIIPFVGRTAIGWIVDVTTIGATLTYGFVSASAWKKARLQADKADIIMGFTGMLIMMGFGCYLLLPNLFTTGTLEPESYFLFTLWAILGFIFFRNVMKRDRVRRFGRSIIVWFVLLGLILFTAMVWMNQATIRATGDTINRVDGFYREEIRNEGADMDEHMGQFDVFMEEEISNMRHVTSRTLLVVAILFGVSLWTLMMNYNLMKQMMEEREQELGSVRNIVNTDPLTGVKSKAAFISREREINDAMGTEQEAPFGLVIFDVNGLKYMNDTFGHKVGDEYLQRACRLICEVFAHSPVYRIGGDEFVALLLGGDYEDREAVLREFNLRVEENLTKNEVVIAAGMATYRPEEDRNLRGVFDRADGRMYERKMELKSQGAITREGWPDHK